LTTKNILIYNLSPEAIEDINEYLILKGYNNTIISDYYPTNESRDIINLGDKLYQVQISDSRYIENSSADKSFMKEIVHVKFKHFLINPYRNYLINTINGEIIFQAPKDKKIADEENLKTAYHQFSLDKNKVFSVQRLKAMMFVKNSDITKNKKENHKDRNRWKIILIILNDKVKK
jgi:hypothetical protein